MTDAQRQAIVEILRKHPRFGSDFRIPDFVRPEQEGEWLFQQAAIWPDTVRGGPPERTAFHRGRWHYVNVPHFLSTADEAALEGDIDVNLSVDPPVGDFDDKDMNVIQAIRNSARILKDPQQLDSTRAVHICWLLHLIADLHQPLHSTALFSEEMFPQGDRGGNSIRTTQLNNLHSSWDRAFGDGSRFDESRNIAIQLLADDALAPVVAEAASTSNSVEAWRDQSHEIAIEHVYTPEVVNVLRSLEEGGQDTDDQPLTLSSDYLTQRRAVSDRQALRAGVRIASVFSGATMGGGTESVEDRLLRLETKVDRLTSMLETVLQRLTDDE